MSVFDVWAIEMERSADVALSVGQSAIAAGNRELARVLRKAERLFAAADDLTKSFTGDVGPEGFMLPDYQVKALLRAIEDCRG